MVLKRTDMSEPEVPTIPVDDSTNPVQQMAAEAAFEADNSESEDAVLDRIFGKDDSAPQQNFRTIDPEPQNDPDFDRAFKALQRDGVPAYIIDSIKSDPSKMKEWGLKAAKRQADVDSFGSKKANSAETPTPAPVASKISPDNSKNSGDSEDDADPLSVFGDIFGDEAAKPLRAITERLRSDFEEKTKAMEVKYETRGAYERMSALYGNNSPSFDDITKVAAQIGRENPGQFESISDIVQEAFRMRAGEPKRSDPRNSARPTVGKAPARVTREIDREDAVLDILLSGGSRADALRVLSR
jgi:hypothetical protein